MVGGWDNMMGQYVMTATVYGQIEGSKLELTYVDTKDTPSSV